MESENRAAAQDDEDETNCLIRPLEITDYSKGFGDLITQLTPAIPLTEGAFLTRFSELTALGADHHLVLVAEDSSTGSIAGAGAIIIEKKFIRRLGKVGHVEDVVVEAGPAAAASGIRERLVKRLGQHAKDMGCYKVILNCEYEMKGYYEKCGFVEKNAAMGLYL